MARTFGDTRDCGGCRFWSEMVAQVIGGGSVEALCLSTGPMREKYTTELQTCAAWASGHFGAVDDPPNYGEQTRRLYAEEGDAA